MKSATPTSESTRPGKRPLCDLRWAGSLPDAHSRYAAARALGPVCFDPGQNCWCILGYDAAFACLSDPARFKREPVFGFSFTADKHPATQQDYRRLLREAIAGFDKATVAALTDRWLDRFLGQSLRPADFDAVADLGVPMIDDIVGQMIGLLPDEISCLASFRPPNRTDFYGSDRLVLEFFTRVFEDTNSTPRAGVIRALSVLRVEGVLTRPQAAGLTRMLWVGATATTNLLIASALMLLARCPAIQSRLRAEHGLVPKFLAEVLRLESPSTVITRTVQSAGDFFGADFQLGDVVKVCVLSANSDSDIFARPLEVDLDRPSNRQLEFGFGAHFCPGANIARELAETAVARILRYSSLVTAAEELSRLEYEEGDLRALKRLRIRIS